jgi:hypothetical protein
MIEVGMRQGDVFDVGGLRALRVDASYERLAGVSRCPVDNDRLVLTGFATADDDKVAGFAGDVG